jgi:transposase
MTIAVELEAQILRLYHVEKWRCGTIAKQLHVHRETVQRVLAHAGLPRHGPPPRASMIEPYLSFIQQTLEKFPSLTASRLYSMVRERGYPTWSMLMPWLLMICMRLWPVESSITSWL